ncbi:hypothetical protein RO3G_07903 [Rhizopus delemar RA 99-880]|uniref:Uncharacterized protein n=1 Tax=Rhizopus delemar (strain RA 99-880 / ATCC MYA-4621 / FGSC 9543 / NRRL 43880) TaxID=246409 RepID=I1C418_RHIO9|nr:hypothetical protein RO3G_07903 [Rhizopus delemar RA 99-880]|eukprot:EIE83198.1 hypothetical protein RO3G_07903 [Rhizopus delemar RA 99-880]
MTLDEMDKYPPMKRTILGSGKEITEACKNHIVWKCLNYKCVGQVISQKLGNLQAPDETASQNLGSFQVRQPKSQQLA